MRRLIRFIIIIPALVVVWAFANSVGITQAITSSAGLPDLDWVTIPGIERVLEVGDDVDSKRSKVGDEVAERTGRLREKAGDAADAHQRDLHDGAVDDRAVRKTEKRLDRLDVEPASSSGGYERERFGDDWTTLTSSPA